MIIGFYFIFFFVESKYKSIIHWSDVCVWMYECGCFECSILCIVMLIKIYWSSKYNWIGLRFHISFCCCCCCFKPKRFALSTVLSSRFFCGGCGDGGDDGDGSKNAKSHYCTALNKSYSFFFCFCSFLSMVFSFCVFHSSLFSQKPNMSLSVHHSNDLSWIYFVL